MGLLRRTLATQAPSATILIRLIVGGTFLSEGVQKFLFARCVVQVRGAVG